MRSARRTHNADNLEKLKPVGCDRVDKPEARVGVVAEEAERRFAQLAHDQLEELLAQAADVDAGLVLEHDAHRPLEHRAILGDLCAGMVRGDEKNGTRTKHVSARGAPRECCRPRESCDARKSRASATTT